MFHEHAHVKNPIGWNMSSRKHVKLTNIGARNLEVQVPVLSSGWLTPLFAENFELCTSWPIRYAINALFI